MFADAKCTCQSNVNWLHACMQAISEVFNFIYVDIEKL